eukprot:4501945-Alexandrium_andersonii.AAC.1
MGWGTRSSGEPDCHEGRAAGSQRPPATTAVAIERPSAAGNSRARPCQLTADAGSTERPTAPNDLGAWSPPG